MARTIYNFLSINGDTGERTGGRLTLEDPPEKTFPGDMTAGCVIEIGTPGATFHNYLLVSIEDVITRK